MGQCLTSTVTEVLDAAAQATAQATGGSSYPTLPSGAQAVSVRNVYDGDTLTLVDERRVRLLGIDTPEIKQKQPCIPDLSQQ